VKGRFLTLIAVLIGLLVGLGCASKEEPLVFIFTPGPGQELAEIEELYGDAVLAVSEQIGQSIELKVSTSNAGSVEALCMGQADGGRFGPFAYILAEQQCEVFPVVREVIDGKGSYTSVIIGKPGIWEQPFVATQLVGKQVALVDPGSTSGYLTFITYLAENDMDLEDLGAYYFTEGHPVAIEAVINGAADVAAVASMRLLRAEEAGEAVEGENYEVLWVSPEVTLSPWIVSAESGIDVDELRAAFIAVPPEAMGTSSVEEFISATAPEYDFIRSMAKLKGDE